MKTFLTIFPELNAPGNGRVILYKDIGSIPFYLSETCGWQTAVAFFSSYNKLADETYERSVKLIPIKSADNRLIKFMRMLSFIVRNARQYAFVNFYLDSLQSILYALSYKIINPSATIYIKLDMDHMSANNIVSKSIYQSLKMYLKHVVSFFAVDFYTVECTQIYKMIFRHYHYRDKLHLLPNGFTLREERKSEQYLSSKKNIILTVGRLGTYQKYTELLVNAIARINKDIIKEWKVYLAGPLDNPEFKQHIENSIKNNPHLRDTFVFTGTIDDKNLLYELYAQSKIFCLTSRWEGFPLVLPEAMYFGNYIISSDLPASRDLTAQGTIGSLFPVGDELKLAELITNAISGKINLEQKARESHDLIINNYDWRFIVIKLEKLLLSRGKVTLISN